MDGRIGYGVSCARIFAGEIPVVACMGADGTSTRHSLASRDWSVSSTTASNPSTQSASLSCRRERTKGTTSWGILTFDGAHREDDATLAVTFGFKEVDDVFGLSHQRARVARLPWVKEGKVQSVHFPKLLYAECDQLWTPPTGSYAHPNLRQA
ncbi:hypothetical protein BD309DRAFT_1002690 [Dichomitus squalens]|nr:hypothetical protein BD309DRAFT_1002690 [Dichomitus squalens]